MKFLFTVLIVFFSIVLFSQTKDSIKEREERSINLFKDELDGSFDFSNFLGTKSGFLPVPTIITNPATGYGGALAVMFLHSSFEESKGYPSITVALGGGTENKTWMAGLFHMQSFWKKRIRYSGGVMYVNFNSRFYGLGYTDYFLKNNVTLNLKGVFFFQKGVMRIGKSNLFTGLKYTLFKGATAFDPIPDFLKQYTDQDFTISDLNALMIYDTRDNFFSPSKGLLSQIEMRYSDDWLGASASYLGLNSYLLGYTPILKKHQIGMRCSYNMIQSDAPFFAQPFVSNRGVAFFRYQDVQVLEAEVEMMLNVYKRWFVLGFAGTGDAYGTNSTVFEKDVSTSGGAGFRYLIARKFGMKAGVDFAWDEQFAFQFVVGSAWLRN